MGCVLFAITSTFSYANTPDIEKLEIKQISYHVDKWYVRIHDVNASKNLSFEQLFVDDNLAETINAGTATFDHKRVFTLSESYNPDICHNAYMVLFDNNQNIVKKSKKFTFGNMLTCKNNENLNKSHTPTTYYISLNGIDENDGKTLNTAFKSISHALNVAKGGDKILLKGGIYRESNILYGKPNISGKYITLENYNNEKVVIKGSKVVKKWEQYKDNIWKISGKDNSELNRTIHYQQVFYGDGKNLQKVGYPNYLKKEGKHIWKSPSKRYVPIVNNQNNPFGMSEGTFYVKKLPNDTFDLYVWLPQGKTPMDADVSMEVSDARFILYAYDVNHLKLKGLSFMHSASAGFGNFHNGLQGGVGVTVGRYAIVEDCDISYMDFAGLSLSLGSRGKKSEDMHQKVIHSKIHHNGDVGISIIAGGFFIFENEFYENGHRAFIQYWHGGAIKTSAGGWGEISDNYIHDERSQGIWFDSCYSNNPIVMRRNYLDNIGNREESPFDKIRSRGHGIFLEHSSNVLLSNNIINNTVQRGIYVDLSKDVTIVNNLIRQSGIEQLGARYRDDLDLKLSNVKIRNNIFIDKKGKHLDIKVYTYENDRNASFEKNNIFENNIIYNKNGLYTGDFSTSHWSFKNNLKDINPLIQTHGSSRLDEWTIESDSPANTSENKNAHLKFDFRRVLRDKNKPMNIGPFEMIKDAAYKSYLKNHLKINSYQ